MDIPMMMGVSTISMWMYVSTTWHVDAKYMFIGRGRRTVMEQRLLEEPLPNRKVTLEGKSLKVRIRVRVYGQH